MKTNESITKKYADERFGEVDKRFEKVDKRFDDVEKSIKDLRHESVVENRRHMDALREGFREEIRVGFEAFSDRPTKEQVREIFREEIQPFHADMLIFKEEMRALRQDSNSHDRRIKKLELCHS